MLRWIPWSDAEETEVSKGKNQARNICTPIGMVERGYRGRLCRGAVLRWSGLDVYEERDDRPGSSYLTHGHLFHHRVAGHV